MGFNYLSLPSIPNSGTTILKWICYRSRLSFDGFPPPHPRRWLSISGFAPYHNHNLAPITTYFKHITWNHSLKNLSQCSVLTLCVSQWHVVLCFSNAFFYCVEYAVSLLSQIRIEALIYKTSYPKISKISTPQYRVLKWAHLSETWRCHQMETFST